MKLSACDIGNPIYDNRPSARYFTDTETTQIIIDDETYSCRFTYHYYEDGRTRVITYFKEVMLIWFPWEHPSKEWLIEEIKENLFLQDYRFELTGL